MYCRKCGEKLQEGARFCPYCMTPLDKKKHMDGAAPKGVRRFLPLILAAAGVLAVAAAVTVLLLRGCNGGEPGVSGEKDPLTAQTGADETGTGEIAARLETEPTSDPVETENSESGTGAETGEKVPAVPTPPDTAPPATTTKSGGTETPATTTNPGGTETPHVHTAVTDPAVPATCTASGLTEGSHCSVCGEILTAQAAIPAKGHVPVTDAAVPATCMATGLTEGSHCSVCGKVFTAQQTVAKTDHHYTQATYSAPATCTVCGATTGTALAAPKISVEIQSGSGFPRKSAYNGNLRIESKPVVETIYNGDGTYTVKVRATVKNISSSTTVVGGIPAKIGYLTSRDADDGWGGSLAPGETGEKGAVFYNVPGGGTFGGVYYVTI